MSKLMINYPHVASMVFNTPLYATPEVVAGVKAVLIPRLTGQAADAIGMDVEDSMPIPSGSSAPEMSERDRELRSLKVVSKVAVINVHGVLVARRGTIDNACSELISYERLRTQITLAMKHDQVEEVVLDFHSGGGHAMGCKELADFIRACTQIKPITAIINFAAYSAAYFLAAACSKIICSPTGGAGSIGVIMETVEVSEWEKEVGIKYNTFYRGNHKNDCSPHEALTEQAAEEISGKLDEAYDIFTSSVAEYLDIPVQSIIDTQARLFTATQAMARGLIHEIKPAQEAINEIAQKYIQPAKQNSIGIRAAAINQQVQL
ncbi:S49 family peptidase [Aliamphritea ceti]|uniref:S49 family peptidase n=1 Tax=Aliamphritea ceti TaxID=1524258 RepID=UPI0021C46208|nr:S49 family peptidase [Aliamphritea ceti]